MTPQEHLARIRAEHGLDEDRGPAAVGGSPAAGPLGTFDPPAAEPLPAYVFHRSVDTGRGSSVEVVVWEDRPEAVELYDTASEVLVPLSRDAAHALGLAIADAIHLRP